jgi:hypothetical protein
VQGYHRLCTVVFLLVSLALGTIGGLAGRAKGSSFFLWALICAIPPYVGLLAVALYRNEHDEPKGQCPGCGKVVPLHQALCTRCGTELEHPDAPLPA